MKPRIFNISMDFCSLNIFSSSLLHLLQVIERTNVFAKRYDVFIFIYLFIYLLIFNFFIFTLFTVDLKLLIYTKKSLYILYSNNIELIVVKSVTEQI